MNEKHTPLLRLAKREAMSSGKRWAIRIAAIALALLAGGIVMALAGNNNPFAAYATILDGALGKKTAVRQTVKNFIPLLGTALAIAPCFKMKFWNIGAEGQITAGAVCATYFALFWAGRLPQVPLLLVMALAGMVGGGLWALVPAFFKARWGTNETLFTLMMNYIIIGFVKWLQGGPWEKQPKGSQQIAQFAENACLPKVAGVYCGWIIVLVLMVLMFLYMKYTKQGYEIAVVGDSVGTARYAGMKVNRIVLRTVFLSACLIGLAAAFKVGTVGILSSSFTDDVGWTGVIVAWLSQLNTGAIFLVSALISMLQHGSTVAAATFAQVDSSFADMLQGAILFLVLAADFLIRFKIVRTKKGGGENGNG